ncbi:hypothetical protein PsAD2_00819 [Pseudovibrio axinellae]|uniref:Extensin-like C-terminal domain-containing protein n=1 Tax=Pseudovibrio axinellae TaxID=989403 RepID=A0A166ATB0_9HYPH|nr:extensin family protein [Pseudovibrio axinellae]KZL21522.1 hypothetical protein PsAD2_00819 [Pseudovibrio axinellae]SER08116.1 Uncharacterized conserved protein [Pseudovibrio axinellae]
MDYKTGVKAVGRVMSVAVVAGICLGIASVYAAPFPKPRPYEGDVVLRPPVPIGRTPVSAPRVAIPYGKPMSLVPAATSPQRLVPKMSTAKTCVLRGWSVEILDPIKGRGGCGIERPVSLRSVVGEGQEIGLTLPVQIECELAQKLDGWLHDVALPAARREFGASITKIRTAAGYACRGRNNKKGAKLSEHGKGNAIDIASFYLSNGREVTVKDGWDGSSAEARFLSGVHKGACSRFTTVLGPNADRYHRDHLHFDQACHGKACTYRVCK